MPTKSFFQVPCGLVEDDVKNEGSDDKPSYGPDTQIMNTLKKIFPSNRRSSSKDTQCYHHSSASSSTNKTRYKHGIVVPWKQPQRRRSSADEESHTSGSGVKLVEIISASVLELFFSTLPLAEQDKVRTMFIDVLNMAGITSRHVFSPVFESTRIKMARMMHETIVRTFIALKKNDPTIDDRIILEIPTFVTNQLTRYNEDFEEIREIGSGGFGKVFQSKSKVDGQLYAIKKIPLKKSTDTKAYQKMLDECRYHASLQHPNIVRYHNAWVDLSYCPEMRSTSPDLCNAKIRSISSSYNSTQPSTNPSLKISAEENIPNKHDSDEDDSASSSSSSGSSKGKGFWAKRRGSCGDASFVSFSTEDQDEIQHEVDECDEDSDSIASDDSLDSNSAKKLAKSLVKSDFIDDLSPRDLQLAIDVAGSDWNFRGYPTLFIQMELCHITLEKYMRHRESHQLPIDVAFNEVVTESLLSAVEFLHQSSVVHRDIKPSNIFIKKTNGKKATILLGDFGLAREIVEELALGDSTSPSIEEELHLASGLGTQLYTSPEQLQLTDGLGTHLTSGLGTYLYASPEQLDSDDYSLSADIYSTGVVIYELYHEFKTGSERINTLMELKKTFQLSLDFQKNWPKLSPILASMITKNPAQRLNATLLLSKFREMKLATIQENEVQRLQLENQKLRAEADLWKEKYLELEKQFQIYQARHKLNNPC